VGATKTKLIDRTLGKILAGVPSRTKVPYQGTVLADPALPEELMDLRALDPELAKRQFVLDTLYRFMTAEPSRAGAAPADPVIGMDRAALIQREMDTISRGNLGPARLGEARARARHYQREDLGIPHVPIGNKREQYQRLQSRGGITDPKKQEAYRLGYEDPNRPLYDWSNERVSPKYYDPKRGWSWESQ